MNYTKITFGFGYLFSLIALILLTDMVQWQPIYNIYEVITVGLTTLALCASFMLTSIRPRPRTWMVVLLTLSIFAMHIITIFHVLSPIQPSDASFAIGGTLMSAGGGFLMGSCVKQPGYEGE